MGSHGNDTQGLLVQLPTPTSWVALRETGLCLGQGRGLRWPQPQGAMVQLHWALPQSLHHHHGQS